MQDPAAHPKKNRTRTEYHRRIERVVDVIRADPAHPFTIRALADHAAFSEFHFHRVFRAVTGETVAQCIRRLRLEMAATALVYHRNTAITEIALNCGFSSSANFSKAFHKAHGCAPSLYRRQRPADFRLRRMGKALRATPVYPDGMSIDVDIQDLPDRHLASLRHVGAYSHAAISRVYAELGAWHRAAFGLPTPEASINITWSDSVLAEEETFRLDICHDVPKGTKPLGRVAIRTLSGGRAACARVSLKTSEMHRISKYWDWLFSDWLPRSRADLGNRPAYEIYRPNADKTGFDITLCLPLTPKSAEYNYD
ncbi:AraC family transcriptional regulator [Gymnodinialimonas sp. 2305UL16-5]|uniref:AraC family transcriptional regulator n=1 Tax=Gymnodinialimonas mytili TaxID=3126503 RepID=UPI0030ACFCB4